MKKIVSMALGLCFMVSVVIAQGPHRHHKHPKLPAEAKAELKQLHQEKIYPVKKAAHDKFLTGLTEEDLAFLEAKRAEGKVLQKARRALKREAKGMRENGQDREAIRTAMQGKMESLKEQAKAFMESMKPFMEKHQELIKGSLEGMKANRQTWQAEKKAILDKYLTEEQKEKMGAHRARKEARMERHPERAEKGDHRKKMMHAVKFVLWDGEIKKEREHKGKDTGTAKSDTESNFADVHKVVSTLSNYPNPAISQTTIIVELATTTKQMLLTITDAQGKQMWKRAYRKLDAGEHKIDVDLKNFANGQYFYTLEISEQQLSKSLIVNK